MKNDISQRDISESMEAEELQIVDRLSAKSSTPYQLPDMTYLAAREAVTKMIEDYRQSVAGISNFELKENAAMLKELQIKFRCDSLVAELACLKANYKSLELALDFIYGLDTLNFHQHEFVPFQINEKELNIAWNNENETNRGEEKNASQLYLNLQQPYMLKSKSAPPKKQTVSPYISQSKDQLDQTCEFAQATLKIRCFICKGKRENHWDQNRQKSFVEQEQNIISISPNLSPRQMFPTNMLKLSVRQQSFYSIRENTA